jgi:serine/threonine-protein kinase
VTPASNLASNARAPSDYRIGRYRVRARLGKGGMGVVYLGRDEALDRDVAIKTLRVEGSEDTDSRGRFEIEAKAAARLQHPNIVTVFELGEDRGLPFIAMEVLGGQDLESLLRSGEKLSVTERLDIVIQTLRGLDFAHAHHIVHRDIKPSNIRVLDDGGVKILDFGIAKVESVSVTRTGMMVGTPYYMSPEHIRGAVLDGRSDVFAVGVILHELFAGARPFAGEEPAQVLYRIIHEPHPRLRPDAAGPLTAELQLVIDMALEKDVTTRFASAALMADELSRIRDRYPSAHLKGDDQLALARARKDLAANRADAETLRAVEAIALANPDSTDAQRLVRLFKRKPSDPQAMAETSSFPELDATFGRAAAQGEATVRSDQTVSGTAPTVLQADLSEVVPPAPPKAPSKAPYFAVAAVLVAGSVGAFLYMRRGAEAPPAGPPKPAITEIFVPATEPAPSKPAARAPAPARPATTVAAPAPADAKAAPPTGAAPASAVPAPAPARPAPAPPSAAIEIRSRPAGATVRLDRKAVGVTPLRVEVAADAPHSISLALPGYVPKEIEVHVPIPGSLDEALSPEGPPSTLFVESSYPVTVTVSGRVVATDKAGATATLPAGTYDVLLESPSVFLKYRESVQLPADGAATVRAPATGTINVRASPDNCKVFVNGVFVDYPPILERAIVAGSHVVAFEWPDGARREEKVQVRAGRPSYLQGKKP